jgi:hypothetical protein
MSDYSALIEHLEREIQRYHMLRQAQPEDSTFANRYQTKIHDLTAAREAVADAAPGLAELDAQIAAAEAALDRAFDDTQSRPEVWPQAGIWAGVLGTVGVLASVGLQLPWQLTVFSVLLLLAAAGCAVMMVRRRRDASGELQYAQERLADLEEQRRSAMPNVAELTGGVV